MKIGSHVSMSGTKMLLGASEEAVSYGANTFMVYTGAPQNTKRKPIDELQIEAATKYMRENGIDEFVVHAPYIINIANAVNANTFNLGVSFLREEIKRTEALGANQIVLHPGAHVGEGTDTGIEQIIRGLNMVLTEDQQVQIALETMAGKGSECGRTFEEIARIIDGVKLKDKLSVCFDTCHVHDAGYDLGQNPESVLEEFDRVIGLDKLKVLHLNDSKNVRGAHKDRHENIGFGEIGFETLVYLAHHPKLVHVPKILETPFLGEDKKTKKAPYKLEIEMIKSRAFNHQVFEMLT